MYLCLSAFSQILPHSVRACNCNTVLLVVLANIQFLSEKTESNGVFILDQKLASAHHVLVHVITNASGRHTRSPFS